jgi:hypothetical protein
LREDKDRPDPGGESDPTRLFRVLQEADPPEEFWSGFWLSVRAGIRDSERQGRSLTTGRALLLGSSAGLMAAVAVLALVFLVRPLAHPPSPGVPLPRAVPIRALAGAEEKAPPPILEDLQSASARVYTFHVGEPADATDVILIVDEKIDI